MYDKQNGIIEVDENLPKYSNYTTKNNILVDICESKNGLKTFLLFQQFRRN